jgi:hypothetical protein
MKTFILAALLMLTAASAGVVIANPAAAGCPTCIGTHLGR